MKYTSPERQELSSVFNFHHLKVDYVDGEKWSNAKLDFHKLKDILMEWQLGIYEGGGWNAIFWCNHDQPRVVTRFGDDTSEPLRKQSAKMLATVLHMLQGTPYIYQGEEIGMTDPGFNDIKQYRDVESLNAYDKMKAAGYEEQEILTILGQKSRDNSRTPVQWTAGEHAGFTSGTPWIDIPNNFDKINVEAAVEDEQSILQTYRHLIQLRHEHDIITYGNIEPLYMHHNELFIYKRHYKGETWIVLANFSKERIEIPEGLKLDGEVIVQYGQLIDGKIDGFGVIVVAQ